MDHRCTGAFLALGVICFSTPSPVFADCDAVIRLARFHDGLRVIVTEDDPKRTRAAARLYPNLANMDFAGFIDKIDAGASTADLIAALETARELTRDVITAADLSPFRFLDARDEVELLADFIDRSGCLDGASGGGSSHSSDNQGSEDGTRKIEFGPKSGSQGAAQASEGTTSLTLILSALAGLTVLAGLVAAIARSRRVKIHMAERLPRHRISLDFPATYTSENGTNGTRDVTALDISLGGMKLKLPDPPEGGEPIDLALPTGQQPATVIWSNTHYAGILFDERLDEADLQTLLTGG